MYKEKFKLHAAVYLILIKNNQILLSRRFNTGWCNGLYTLISGHVDGNESIKHAMLREADEEGGINIQEEDLNVVHTMHRISADKEYIDFFLITDKWKNEPINKEPNKCDDLSWFDLDNLPTNIIPSVKEVLKLYKQKVTFSEFRGD